MIAIFLKYFLLSTGSDAVQIRVCREGPGGQRLQPAGAVWRGTGGHIYYTLRLFIYHTLWQFIYRALRPSITLLCVRIHLPCFATINLLYSILWPFMYRNLLPSFMTYRILWPSIYHALWPSIYPASWPSIYHTLWPYIYLYCPLTVPWDCSLTVLFDRPCWPNFMTAYLPFFVTILVPYFLSIFFLKVRIKQYKKKKFDWLQPIYLIAVFSFLLLYMYTVQLHWLS